jgi:transcriptional regulator with XRE-family HTH domain
MLFGNWVEANNLTLTEVAESLGVATSTVHRYANGRFPTLPMIKKITDFTNGDVSVVDLYQAAINKESA